MSPDAFRSQAAGRVIRVRRPGADYWAFVPNALPPVIGFDAVLTNLLAEAAQKVGELAGAGRHLPDPYLFVTPAMRREAALSSRIEGTRADERQLALFEASPETVHDHGDADQVHRYVKALEFGLKRRESLPLSLRLIREIHGVLMEGKAGARAYPGEFRASQNWIGPPGCTIEAAPYVPPPADAMTEALHGFESYLHAPSPPHRLVRLALIHYQFEAIHPFVDGNGRVGRLLIILLLCAWGDLPQPLLYLSEFFERNQSAYYDALLQVSRKGAWTEWLRFFLQGVAEQSAAALAQVRRIMDFRERVRDTVEGRAGSRLVWALADGLFRWPALTVKTVQEQHRVSFHTAERAIAVLEGLGLLREITGNRRNRIWMADRHMDALAGQA